LSQAELARRAGIKQETLNSMEQGKKMASFPGFAKVFRALEAREKEMEANGK
jgi:DNA-binding XRE family transcriptional regulator